MRRQKSPQIVKRLELPRLFCRMWPVDLVVPAYLRRPDVGTLPKPIDVPAECCAALMAIVKNAARKSCNLGVTRAMTVRWCLCLGIVSILLGATQVATGVERPRGERLGSERLGSERLGSEQESLKHDAPNVVFAFADDWGRLAGAYAALEQTPGLNALVPTPNIDRVAERGVVFTNAFVNAPSCTPCRSSLLSGQHFWRTGRGAILQGGCLGRGDSGISTVNARRWLSHREVLQGLESWGAGRCTFWWPAT